MEKMNAITFAKTGHVLGVLTRASQADEAASATQVAEGGFRLRDSKGNNIIVEIPEDEIRVSLVDYDTRVLYQPYLFALEEGKPVQKTDASPPNLDVTLNGTHITATLPNNVSEPTDVWCQISGGGLTEVIVRPVTIPGTSAVPTDSATEELLLGAGSYKVAMFAPEYAVAVFTEMVP